MRRHGVRKLVFSSSATVYGEHAPVPISEDCPTVGHQPLRPDQGDDRADARATSRVADPDLRIALLRYFNPVGAHPSGTIGEDPRASRTT